MKHNLNDTIKVKLTDYGKSNPNIVIENLEFEFVADCR